MNIRCAKCGTDHEYDESRVGADGVTVKCTSCGFVFRIGRPGAKPQEWMVRQPGGNIFRFKELTTLQKWIVERTVTRDDEISPNGEKWQRLGEIGELASFFQVVERASAPGPAAPVVEAKAPLPLGAHLSISPAAEAALLPAAPAPVIKEKPAAPRRPLMVAVSCAVLGLALATLAIFAPALFDGARGVFTAGARAEARARADAAVATGVQALLRDDDASLTAAESALREALAAVPDHAGAEAGLARVYLVRSERVLDDPAWTPERVGQVARALGEAWVHALRARELAPEDAAVLTVVADHHRLTRAPELANALTAAQADAGATPGAHLLYVLGAFAADGQANLDQAVEHLSSALAGEPGYQRCRYRLAQLHLRMGARDRARALAQELVAANPAHTEGKALLAQLSAPPVEPVVAPPVPAAAPSKPRSADELLAQADALREREQVKPAMRLYERVLALDEEDPEAHLGLGWCHLDLEQWNLALASFRTAIRVAPDLADAYFGMSEVHNERGERQEAAQYCRKYLELNPGGADAGVCRERAR